MDSSKLSTILFICMLFISSLTPILACGSCGSKPPHKHKPKTPKGPINLPPVKLPPVKLPPITKPTLPPVTLPPVTKLPPVTLPPVTKLPPVTLPPVTKLPPVGLPPITKPTLPPVGLPLVPLPPVGLPPVLPVPLPLPPVGLPPVLPVPLPPVTTPTAPSPTTSAKCPIDTLKLGACVDLLGGLVHVGLGDPVVNKCCPVLKGLVELEAAVCLCTTLKLNLLNIKVYLPIALELLVTCGKTPPPGFTCSV